MEKIAGSAMLFGIIFIIIASVAVVMGVSMVQNFQIFMPRAEGSPRPKITPFVSYKQTPTPDTSLAQ